MQENYDYYEICQRTERNKGLYTADQLVRRTDRRGTRQNPNGNRHGFECPEERDYYPWWGPSPWIDIAVLSDEAKDDGTACYPSTTQSDCSKRCQYYMSNTMNFNAKGYCDPNHSSGSAAQKTGSPPESEKVVQQCRVRRSWFQLVHYHTTITYRWMPTKILCVRTLSIRAQTSSAIVMVWCRRRTTGPLPPSIPSSWRKV